MSEFVLFLRMFGCGLDVGERGDGLVFEGESLGVVELWM